MSHVFNAAILSLRVGQFRRQRQLFPAELPRTRNSGRLPA